MLSSIRSTKFGLNDTTVVSLQLLVAGKQYWASGRSSDAAETERDQEVRDAHNLSLR